MSDELRTYELRALRDDGDALVANIECTDEDFCLACELLQDTAGKDGPIVLWFGSVCIRIPRKIADEAIVILRPSRATAMVSTEGAPEAQEGEWA